MLRTNYRCVRSLNISVDVAKCVENVDTLIHYTHFWTVTKKTCLHWTIFSWQCFNSLVCHLMLKTNYRCVSVTQHQCRRRQMCRKCSQIHQVHSLFVRYKKRLVLIEQSIHGEGFNSLGCPLTLRTNYRCVQSLNICVDVAKCVENVQTLIHYTHFWTVTKKDLSSLNNLFMAKFELNRMSSYAKKTTDVFSHSTSV